MKCSKSKTIRHSKLKNSHHVDLIISTSCQLFSFLDLNVLDLEHFKVLSGLVFYRSPLLFQLFTIVPKLFYSPIMLQNLNLLILFVVRKVLHAKVCSPESFQLFCLCGQRRQGGGGRGKQKGGKNNPPPPIFR